MLSRLALGALALAAGLNTATGQTVGVLGENGAAREVQAKAYNEARAAENDDLCAPIDEDTLVAQRANCPLGAHTWSVSCGKEVAVEGAPRVPRTYNHTTNKCSDCVGGYDATEGNKGECEEYTQCGVQIMDAEGEPLSESVSRLTGETAIADGYCAQCNTGSYDNSADNDNDCKAGPTCGTTTDEGGNTVSRLTGGSPTEPGHCGDCNYGHFGPLDNDNNAPDCKCNVRTACNLGEAAECAYHRSAEDYDAGCKRTDSASARSFLIKGASPGTFTKTYIDLAETVPDNHESSDQFTSLEEAYAHSWSDDCYNDKGELSLYVTADWKAGDDITCMKKTDASGYDKFTYDGGNNKYDEDQSTKLNRWYRVQELCNEGYELSVGEYDINSGALLRPVCKESVDCQITGEPPTIDDCVNANEEVTQEYTPAQYGGAACDTAPATEQCAPVNCDLGLERTRDECTSKGEKLERQVITAANKFGTACEQHDPITCVAGDGTPPNTVPGEPCVVGVIREGDASPYDDAVDRELEGTDCKQCGILLQDVITEAELNGEACARDSIFCKTGDGAQGDLVCPMQEDELKSGMVLLRKSGDTSNIPRWFKIYGGVDGAGFTTTSNGETYTGFKIQYCQTPNHVCTAGATTHLGVGGPGEGHGFAYNYFPRGSGVISDTYWTVNAASNVNNCDVEKDDSGNDVFYKSSYETDDEGNKVDQIFKKQWLQSWTAEAWDILKADHTTVGNGGTGLYMLSSNPADVKGCPGAIHVKGCHDTAAGNYDSEANAYGGVNCCRVSSMVEGTDYIWREVYTACDASFCGNQANGDSRYDVTSYTISDISVSGFNNHGPSASQPYDTTLTSSSESYGSREEKTLSIHILTMVDTPTYKVVTTRDSGTTETSPQNLQVGLNSITVAEDFQNGHRTVKVQFSRGDITYSELLINGEGARADGRCDPCASGTWAFTSADDCVSYTTCGTQTNGVARAQTLLNSGSTDELFVCAACSEGEADNDGADCVVDCAGSWSGYGECDTNTGLKTKTYLTTQEPLNGGTPCPEPETQTCPVNCVGDWEETGVCNDADTGKQLHTYRITQAAQNGGDACAYVEGRTTTTICNVDCVGDWSNWGNCDAEVGGGGDFQREYTVSQRAWHSGTSCEAAHEEVESLPCVHFPTASASASKIKLKDVEIDGQLAFADTDIEVTNAGYPKVYTLTTKTIDGVTNDDSKNGLTLSMYVRSVPDGGATYRIFKTLENGNTDTSDAEDLLPGDRSIYVFAVDFTRTVKIQFSSGDIEISALGKNSVIETISDASAAGGDAEEPTSQPVTIDDSSAFTAGPTAWPKVLVATTVGDGAASQNSQTFTMNVVSLPAGGANFRVYKTTANGGDFFANPVALTLGSNSITVGAVGFDRAVKFQFDSGDVEFDALTVNGEDQLSGGSSHLHDCNDFVNGPTDWPKVLVATTAYDGAPSQGAQTFTMNVVSLPAGGANFRVYKTTANGGDFFGNAMALALGSNTITVGGVGFDRAVKFQFSSEDVEFDSLTLNGVASTCV